MDFRFDFRDVPRAGRLGFSTKKIFIHFIGLLLAYTINEILIYLSLLIVGVDNAREFWNNYALLPICPFVTDSSDFKLITKCAMWMGMFFYFVVFFLTSTMVSKVTIQQLRGDHFFSISESGDFTKKNWKVIFGTFIGITLIFAFALIMPITIGLLGMIPGVGHWIVMLSSILMPIAFLIGLLMAYLIVVLGVSLLFAPSVIATADSDVFETIEQHFSMIWNQPWRIIIYEGILLLTKIVCGLVWSFFCLIGFVLILLPIHALIPKEVGVFMSHANVFLGNLIEKSPNILNQIVVFDLLPPQSTDPIALKITGFIMAISILSALALVAAYILSIASAGNTVIYSILRKRTDNENLLENEDLIPTFPDQSQEETDSNETEENAESVPEISQTPEDKIAMETVADNEEGKIDN